MLRFHVLWSFCLLLFIQCSTVNGQVNGLAFSSHDVIQDKRTGLALGTRQPFCFPDGFELSFELAFTPKQHDYFGYIVRVLEDNERNIDLIYDYGSQGDNKHFKVVIGNSFSRIAFNLPGIGKDDRWHNINFRFDRKNKMLYVDADGQQFSQPYDPLGKGCSQLFFGAGHYPHFNNADVPPMMVRNIRLHERTELRHSWPLGEWEGAVAVDSAGSNDGEVSNPLWIKMMHSKWQPLRNLTAKGCASVAFNAKDEVLYIVTCDSLFSYGLSSNTMTAAAYSTGRQALFVGHQSIYSPKDHRIYTLSMNMDRVGALDLATMQWDKQFENPGGKSSYYHFNKYYSGRDSAIYTFNGYGYFLYMNDVYRYDMATHTTQKIDLAGDSIEPRYLAALGEAQKGAYMLGGYGSLSGRQVLNPDNLYDLQYFEPASRKFRKLFSLKVDSDEFVLANSLVVDEEERCYYGLTFPKHRFDADMQLIKGSLDKPEFSEVGEKVPFRFRDIQSYADLFYGKTSKRFLTATLFNTSDTLTEINLYSLSGPPLSLHAEQAVKKESKTTLWLMGAGIVALLITGLVSILRRKRKPVKKTEMPKAPSQKPAGEEELLVTPPAETPKSAIFLFGDFQAFDSEGVNVTKLFTPLIRELFLVILLYTIRWERGISSEKLKELLWSDKTAGSARNNQAVNIAKLKNILERIGHCELSRETGYWRIHMDQLQVDYRMYMDIIRQHAPDRKSISSLMRILDKGNFLPTDEHEWLDPFKSEITNDVTDRCLQFTATNGKESDPGLLIRIADHIFRFDSVNEDAVSLKCHALVQLGKHTLARNTFEQFTKEYHKLYGEDFDKSYQDVLNHQ